MLNILYYIFLFPFEKLFLFILNSSLYVMPPGISLIVLSIIINAIYIPISLWAKKIELKEQEKQAKVKADISEIKKHYKGEEAFRKIEAVYKKHQYNIFLSFRANLTLLIMIPFFVAAVLTLNNNSIFENTSFLCIDNLFEPDRLIYGVNFLPFLMTIINLVSIKMVDASKSFFCKDNIKLIILALLFLIFLYNKSAALLIYWTSNNLIFLLRTIITNKLKH